MPLASSYYSACGNAYAQFRTAPWQYKFLWMRRTMWCLWRARRLSDKRARHGIESMSADELDVYARILMRQKRYHEAITAVVTALRDTALSIDTKVMLWMSLMQINLAQFLKNKEKFDLDSARNWYGFISEQLNNLNPTTRVRVLRALAEFDLAQKNQDAAARHAAQARKIAVEHRLNDQLLKLAHLP
jgi:hypothetical protein